MKLKKVKFDKPVRIFQVFRNINVYGKEHKSIADRKKDITWTEINSKAGHIIDNKLYLPEQIVSDTCLKACDLITIEDDQQPQTFTPKSLQFTKVYGHEPNTIFNHCLKLNRPDNFDIFKIVSKEEIEIYIEYGYFKVGIPTRNDFKLCNIRKNQPIEIKINGKTDYSMSKGRARIFKEQFYIFDYIGDFDECSILEEPYEPIIKHVPKPIKTIDLLKTLW